MEEEVSCLKEAAEPPESAYITVQDQNPHVSTSHKEKNAALTSIAPLDQAVKTTKKASRARRKFCLNDEVEQSGAQQASWEMRAAGLEDTFIFGLKPKRRQAKPKTEEEAVADEFKQKTTKAAPRVGKTTKAKEQLEDNLEPDNIPEPAAEIEKLERKQKTTRKKPLASEGAATIATEVNDASRRPIEGAADHAPVTSGKYFTAAKISPGEIVKTVPKPAKAKAAPKRALKRSVDEAVTAVESMNTATPEKQTKRPRRQAAISAIEKVTMGFEEELIPVDKLRRAPDVGSKPRKSHKVDVLEPSASALLSPPLTTQADSSTKDVQTCGRDESPSSPPPVVKRGRKPSVKTAKGRTDAADEKHEVTQTQPAAHLSPRKDDSHVPDDQQSLPLKMPAKRGRKPSSENRKVVAATTEEEPSVEAAVAGLVPDHLSPTKENSYTPDDEPTLAPKLPAKRGRKLGSKNRKVVAATNPEEPTVEQALIWSASDHLLSSIEQNHTLDDEPKLAPKLPAKRGRNPRVKNLKTTTIGSDPTMEPIVTELAPGKTSNATGSEPPATTTPRHGKARATECIREASEDSRSTEPSHEADNERSLTLARQPSRESSRKMVEQQPTKQRRALADFDGNIVRKSFTVESKKLTTSTTDSASPPRKRQSNTRKTKKDSALQSDTTTIHSASAQRIPQFECSQDEGPSHETVTATPGKRRVIAAEEDLDWLFEKSKSRRPKPATLKQPATKTRQMAADPSAKDMDLDDLLATVAGFSGKLLTGRCARVVAR